MSTVPAASKTPHHSKCPHCGSFDLRISEGKPSEKLFLFTRATFCRRCWWTVDERLVDDAAKALAAGAGTHNDNQTRRAGHA